MNVLETFWSWMRAQVAAAKGPARLWAALLAALVLAGAIRMLHAERRQDTVPAVDRRLTGRRLSAAVELPERCGIACRTNQGQVLVPRKAAMRADRFPADEGFVDDQQFEQFIVGGDLWTTKAQSDTCRRVAKMATPSRLIGKFPSVRRAVVLPEPGRRSDLRRRGTKPTAAVHAGISDSVEMTSRPVAVIADMVAGSIVGLERRDVRVIDSRGRRYRVGDASPTRDPRGPAAEEALARRRRMTSGRAAIRECRAMLNRAAGATEKSILDGLSRSRPQLARSICGRMPAFENIVHVPEDRLGEALILLDPFAVAVAPRMAGDELRSKVLGSLPGGRARLLRRQMGRIGPIRLSGVEPALSRQYRGCGGKPRCVRLDAELENAIGGHIQRSATVPAQLPRRISGAVATAPDSPTAAGSCRQVLFSRAGYKPGAGFSAGCWGSLGQKEFVNLGRLRSMQSI